jgi:hypothetical protein
MVYPLFQPSTVSSHAVARHKGVVYSHHLTLHPAVRKFISLAHSLCFYAVLTINLTGD